MRLQSETATKCISVDDLFAQSFTDSEYDGFLSFVFFAPLVVVVLLLAKFAVLRHQKK